MRRRWTARAQQLTLEEAVRLALTRNERARISDLDVEIAEADVDGTRTLFLPVIDASGSVAYRPRNDPSVGAQAQLALSQPIFNPSAFPLYAQSKHVLAGQKQLRIDERRRLAFDTANAFVAVLLAERVVQAAERKHETAVANLASTDAQVKAQLVSSNDVTRAQINVSTATRELEASKGNQRAAVLELELLINARVDGGLAAPTALLAAGRAAPGSEDDLVSRGITRRADLLANKELARAAHDFAREPRMRYLPTIELGGQVSATSGAGDTLDALVAISARWTLWDSGQRSADARARGARARIADLETTQLARTIDAEIRSAAVLLASRQQALAAAADARDAARKGADEAAILYRQGLAKAIELVDANDQRFIAEVNYATSEFDVARAYLALRLATGEAAVDGVAP
jgi:outer membrane protein TolC